MKLEFFYVCTCGLEFSSVMSMAGLNFIDSSCNCPSCGEEIMANETKVI